MSAATADMFVEPAAHLRGHLAVPGDKSISHRAVLIGALCDGETRVTGFGRSADTESTVAAVRALGVDVYEHGDDTLRQDLWTALGRLPRGQRAVVVLRYFEDLTEAETARLLGCSVGTVKSQTARAFTRLRIDHALLEGREMR